MQHQPSREISNHREARPPARRPRRELSLGVSARSPARPSLRPRVPQPGPVGEVTRWSETIVAFACLCLCGIETAVAFAGGKWVFLVQLLGAEVMLVSVAPCWG